VPEGFKVLQEGKARILQKGNDVFYNEAQVRRCREKGGAALAQSYRNQIKRRLLCDNERL
jgi:hypothetical protein